MKTYGGGFKAAWWRDLFSVAFKVRVPCLRRHHSITNIMAGVQIFNVMKLPEQQSERAEWMMTTCNHALYAIVDVFSQYFDALADLVLPDLYEQLQSCIQSGSSLCRPSRGLRSFVASVENEQLARSAIFCLENLVVTNGHRFSEEIWNKTVELLLDVFQWSRPIKLAFFHLSLKEGK